mmetsp:Transcript_35158/g.53894  ORF Transcript_35158/g.53894 Transcript_35158/m.53894 type:complete len:80 (+) Transcript_35158:429-668(+)
MMEQLDSAYNDVEARIASLESVFSTFMDTFSTSCTEKMALIHENLQLRSELTLLKEENLLFNTEEGNSKTDGSPTIAEL